MTTPPGGQRRLALVLVGAACLLWSGLCGALELAGHAPTGPTLSPHWYGVQAALVWLVVPLQAVVVGQVGSRLAGVHPRGRWAGAIGLAVAVAGFVVTDIGAWAVVGFHQLGLVLRVTAPLAFLLGVAVGAVRLRRQGAGLARAVGAMVAGIFVAALVGGPFLR